MKTLFIFLFSFLSLPVTAGAPCDQVLASGNVKVIIKKNYDLGYYYVTDTVPMIRACGDSVIVIFSPARHKKYSTDDIVYQEL